jgi:two-component system LytT family response regulator
VVETVGIDRMPMVVFITAYDEHALRAFDVQALDYLLKPFSPKRFAQMLDRIRQRAAGPAPAPLARQLEQLLLSVQPVRYLKQLFVEKGRDREVLLRVEHITRVVSDGNYLRFLTDDGEFLKRGGLADIEARLDPGEFLRINRSEIVRLDAVAEFQPWFHGDYRVKMKDGTVLAWSRRYRSRTSLSG